ncbi:MAG: D-galactarate dehydratase [SAR116 cluster bacterium]|nr:D-galactarate dehydratase [SAR116 cluster bacterium]|tara:strand:+ start:2008 stop:2295 length:288 start_codon:yes stop_codon:yes gene_type:complete
MKFLALCSSNKDNVANTLDLIPIGQQVEIKNKKKTIISSNKIPKYHKIALNEIPKGASIIKNGICIGTATKEIDIGAHIHVHNIVSNRAVLKVES